DRLDLLIAELAVVRHQRATVLMTRPDSAVKQVQRFPEAIVAEMRHVEDHTQPFDLLEQLAAFRVESTAGIRAVGINPRSIMCRTNGAQSLFVSALQMIQRDDGICSFKTEDITDGQFTRGRGPGQAVIG